MLREKEITIYDLARKLNISIATVSRALKDDPVVSKKTKKKIFDLAEEVGYRSNHFARNLRNQRTDTIGVIVPRLNSYFMSTIIAGMESIAILTDLISSSASPLNRSRRKSPTPKHFSTTAWMVYWFLYPTIRMTSPISMPSSGKIFQSSSSIVLSSTTAVPIY